MVLQILARSRNLRSVCLEVFFGGWFCISESQIFLSLGLKVWNLGLTVLQSLKFTILHSFFCPFSIFNSQVGIFYVWNNCDTNTNTNTDSQKTCCVNYTTEHQRKLKKYVFTLIFCWITFIIARSSCHESETSRMLSAFPSFACYCHVKVSYAGQ